MPKRGLYILLLLLLGAGAGSLVVWLLMQNREAPGPTAGDEREILYWQAPMDPSFHSDKPGKSPMGMDLVPVYADGKDDTPKDALKIDAAVINTIGVRTAMVERGVLPRRVETVGFIQYDEKKVAEIDVRIEGWIEDLRVRSEGEAVRRGDLLFRIYSRPLVGAQAEYLQAVRIGDRGIKEAAAERLLALGMTRDQLKALEADGKPRRHIDIRAPQDGILVALEAREGAFVKPGKPVMRFADLSSIWVQVDVYEEQIGWIEDGQAAKMTLAFAPGEDWRGAVDYVYPNIDEKSRTGRVRLLFDNPDLRLKPGMYASVSIEADPRLDALHIPREALIRTGRSERVILALGGGRFRPAEVRAGIEYKDRVEILAGLMEGEAVVTSGQFLIDSEASLTASFLRMINGAGNGEHQHD